MFLSTTAALVAVLACYAPTTPGSDDLLPTLGGDDTGGDADTDTDADTDADSDTDTTAPCTLDPHPGSVDFGETLVNYSVSSLLSLENIGDMDCTVTSVYLDLNQVRLTRITDSVIVAGSSATLTVTYKPDAAGALDDTIHIESDDPNSPDLIVPVTGNCSG